MDVFCHICGCRWDARDPAVRFIHGDGSWECYDEPACFDRAAIQRGLDRAWAALEAAQRPALQVVPDAR